MPKVKTEKPKIIKLTPAIELALELEKKNTLQEQVCEMLRHQNSAIWELREALEEMVKMGKASWGDQTPCVRFGLEVLQSTEEFKFEHLP